MDTRTGEIHSVEQVKEFVEKGEATKLKFLKRMNVPPTTRQMLRKPPSVGRNEICPCGSGRKFKKCCLVR